MSAPLFHVAAAARWEDERPTGRYRPAGLEEEGFVHCCTRGQLEGTLARWFARPREAQVLLWIDPAALEASVVHEDLYDHGEAFPHVYGPVEVAAVRAVLDLAAQEAGPPRPPVALPSAEDLEVPVPASARLLFRPWRPDDDRLAFALWGDPRVTARIDARPRLDAAAVRGWLERELRLQEESGIQYWPVFLRKGGDFVGAAGLRPRPEEPGVPELGFHLRPAYWGRGLAQEAGEAALAFAFEVLGAEAVFAGHHPENAASATVLERLGFAYTHDEPFEATGLEHPSYRRERPA